MSNPLPVVPLSRATISGMLSEITNISSAVGRMEYRHAVPVMAALENLSDTVSEMLPGGFVGNCENCGGAIAGEDKLTMFGDVCFCTNCADIPQEDRAND